MQSNNVPRDQTLIPYSNNDIIQRGQSDKNQNPQQLGDVQQPLPRYSETNMMITD